mgnify:CR=1 FL=1
MFVKASLVVTPESIYENTTGNPGLATAGTGDVLDGVIAGLIAQGYSTQKAAEFGIYIHGIAGDIAANKKTQAGTIASDIVECLAESLKSISDS